MAYRSDYNYGSGYTTSYSSSYYGYQVAVIFAIVIAGVLLFGICAAIIYFGFVKGMRMNKKQRRTGDGTTSKPASILRVPTTTYTSLRSEKPPFPHQQPSGTYVPSLETPILQSSMHTQPAYTSPPPIYAVQPYNLQAQKQPFQNSYARSEDVNDNMSQRQDFPSSKGITGRENVIPEEYAHSFHTSAV
uniref:Uncharacterized protein n=1 Tax=Setaria digitata TaxID=48799 RepID=A0A915PXH2_9BILA